MNAITGRTPPAPDGLRGAPSRPLVIGLLNNSPGSAYRATQRQFARALRDASGDRKISLQCYALPEIHGDPVACHAEGHAHLSVQMLRSVPPDGLIISGAEPRSANLRDEAYWSSLVQIFAWARQRQIPLLLSCLAAHAAVLHDSDIPRRRLERKCSGVFPVSIENRHGTELAGALAASRTPACAPHSRWHELPEDQLLAHGYRILTRAGEAGVDMFAGPNGQDTLFLNGHPEYEACSLLKEYRRDVGRFVAGEIGRYPDLPLQPISPSLHNVLAEVRRLALAGQGEAALHLLPPLGAAPDAVPAWREHAQAVFGFWLHHVSETVS